MEMHISFFLCVYFNQKLFHSEIGNKSYKYICIYIETKISYEYGSAHSRLVYISNEIANEIER